MKYAILLLVLVGCGAPFESNVFGVAQKLPDDGTTTGGSGSSTNETSAGGVSLGHSAGSTGVGMQGVGGAGGSGGAGGVMTTSSSIAASSSAGAGGMGGAMTASAVSTVAASSTVASNVASSTVASSSSGMPTCTLKAGSGCEVLVPPPAVQGVLWLCPIGMKGPAGCEDFAPLEGEEAWCCP